MKMRLSALLFAFCFLFGCSMAYSQPDTPVISESNVEVMVEAEVDADVAVEEEIPMPECLSAIMVTPTVIACIHDVNEDGTPDIALIYALVEGELELIQALMPEQFHQLMQSLPQKGQMDLSRDPMEELMVESESSLINKEGT